MDWRLESFYLNRVNELKSEIETLKKERNDFRLALKVVVPYASINTRAFASKHVETHQVKEILLDI